MSYQHREARSNPEFGDQGGRPIVFASTLNASNEHIQTVGFDQTSPGTTNRVSALDAGGMAVSWGLSGAPFTSVDQSAAAAAVSAAPTSGQKLVFTDIILSADTAMLVTLSEETSGTVLQKIYMGAETTVNIVTRGKFKLPTANKKLMVRTSAAGNITVQSGYYSEA